MSPPPTAITTQTTKAKRCRQRGMAHPFCSAADDLLESTNPSVAAKRARVPTHNDEEVSWDQLTRRSPIDEEGNDAQAAEKKTEVALEEHKLAQKPPIMRSALYCGRER